MPSTPLQIDFISDVACPWCAVGLGALEEALRRTAGEVPVTLRFEPFELNPAMGPEGQDASEHLTQKYGTTPAQQAAAREGLRARGAAVGFAFKPEGRGRVWNTFDAHRLLMWAGTLGGESQHRLKTALLQAYHGRAERMADHAVLVAAAAEAGLDPQSAQEVLDGDAFADAVRSRERHWQQLGIHAVPSVVINGQHLIQGGQPPEAFEQALRQIAAASQSASPSSEAS